VTESKIREEDLTAEELAQLETYEDAIIGSETADPEVGTNLVHIKFRHSDPQMALKVSNTLAEVFINNNLARMTAGSSKAQDLLAKEIADLQSKIKHDQEAQFNYAKSHNLPMTNEASQNVEWQRLLQLGTQLVDAEKERERSAFGPGSSQVDRGFKFPSRTGEPTTKARFPSDYLYA